MFNKNFVPTNKFSEIVTNIDVVKDYLGLVPEFTFDDMLIMTICEASASYILDYTQLTIEELDKHLQSSLIFLLIVSELYNNRAISLSTGSNGIYNKLLDKLMIGLKNNWL